jgi:hypothetical protein
MAAPYRRTMGYSPRGVLLAILVSQLWASVLGFRRIFNPVLSSMFSCDTAHGQSLMYEVIKRIEAGGFVALQYMATRLQARTERSRGAAQNLREGAPHKESRSTSDITPAHTSAFYSRT